MLRPHMKSCLSCRAALRELRTMPDRVASVVPTAALVAVDGDGPLRSLAESALAAAQQKLESAVGAAQSKTAAMGERLHAAAELATGQKVAAVAASTAALAGGGAAIDEFANHHMRPQALQVQEPEAQPVKEELPVAPTAPPPAETPPADSAAATAAARPRYRVRAGRQRHARPVQTLCSRTGADPACRRRVQLKRRRRRGRRRRGRVRSVAVSLLHPELVEHHAP